MVWSEKRIVDYYRSQVRDGWGRSAIDVLAKINKCSIGEIVELLHKNDLAMHIKEETEVQGKKLTDEQKSKIVQLHQEGATILGIAEKLDVGTSTVSRVLKAEKEKPSESASAEKEKPETAKSAESGTSEKSNTSSIPRPAENVKPPELDTVAMMKQLAAALRSEEVSEFNATFTYSGKRYRVELREAEG